VVAVVAVVAVVLAVVVGLPLLRPDDEPAAPRPPATTSGPGTTASPAEPGASTPTTPPPSDAGSTSAPPTTAADESDDDTGKADSSVRGGGVVVPDDAPDAVRPAATTAQEAATALAAGDWDTARSLISGLSPSDTQLERSWGRLDGVTLVVTDWTEGDAVVLRLGQVAHERTTDGAPRTNLYCVTWTVAGGEVVAMSDQQDVGAQPWRADEWVDPAEAVDTLRSECRSL